MKGSWRWSSPEALLGQCGTEADVYALAWLVWEVGVDKAPYPRVTQQSTRTLPSFLRDAILSQK